MAWSQAMLRELRICWWAWLIAQSKKLNQSIRTTYIKGLLCFRQLSKMIMDKINNTNPIILSHTELSQKNNIWLLFIIPNFLLLLQSSIQYVYYSTKCLIYFYTVKFNQYFLSYVSVSTPSFENSLIFCLCINHSVGFPFLFGYLFRDSPWIILSAPIIHVSVLLHHLSFSFLQTFHVGGLKCMHGFIELIWGW